MGRSRTLLPAAIVAASACLAAAQDDAIARAVAEMRHVRRDVPDDEAKAKADRLDAAWKTLVGAKDAGAKALLDEIRRLDATGEKDDYFKLGAAGVLWQGAGLARAGDIAGIWRGAELTANYNYVFHTAFEASRSGDERAIPMLLAVLHDQRGKVFLDKHAMDVDWPLSHHFVWGPLGSRGMAALAKALATEKDPISLASAVTILGDACHGPALEPIRTIARKGSGEPRRRAIQALGHFGHPADFDFLVSGLGNPDADVAWAHAYALYEFEDLRAVTHLVALADSPDQRLRTEVLAAIGHLPTVDGLESLAERLQAKDPVVRGTFEKEVMPGFRAIGLTWKAYSAKSRDERAADVAALRAKRAEEFAMRPDDRVLSRDDLVRAAKSWIAATRITGGEFTWVETRHVLAAATAADAPLLEDARGALFRRLSNECLDEVKILDTILRRLVRAQYRREPGLCDEAKPPDAVLSPSPK